jgi:acetoin utilization protein AcuB
MDDASMAHDPVSPARRTRVAELMRRDFISVPPDASLDEALQLMRLARLRHLVVVRQGAAVGILSYRSLLESAIDDRGPPSARGARRSVATLMVPDPECITSDRSLEEVAAQLFRLNLGCLPVIDPGAEPPALIGIVTERDLLRAAYDPWFRGRNATQEFGGRSERERDTS